MSKRKRNRNKKNNRNSQDKSQGIQGAVIMKFLKRDGEVGLFEGDDKKKYRVHQTHVYGTLGFIQKGSSVSVKSAYITPVINRRLIAVNALELWMISKSSQSKMDFSESDEIDFNELAKKVSADKYMYGDQIQIVASKKESEYFGLPIGTQYHWLMNEESPDLGDFVMASKRLSTGDFFGYVSEKNNSMKTCVVNGLTVPVEDIGFKITNPEFLKKYNLAIN